MIMLYDSESFSVLHVVPNEDETPTHHDSLPRLGFEIVDKRHGKEVYLDGSWAELFQQHLQAWQANHPTEEEVEDTLDRYASLAQNPLVLH